MIYVIYNVLHDIYVMYDVIYVIYDVLYDIYVMYDVIYDICIVSMYVM